MRLLHPVSDHRLQIEAGHKNRVDTGAKFLRLQFVRVEPVFKTLPLPKNLTPLQSHVPLGLDRARPLVHLQPLGHQHRLAILDPHPVLTKPLALGIIMLDLAVGTEVLNLKGILGSRLGTQPCHAA